MIRMDPHQLDYAVNEMKRSIQDLYHKGEISRLDCERAFKDAHRQVAEYMSRGGHPLDAGFITVRAGDRMIRVAMPFMPYDYEREAMDAIRVKTTVRNEVVNYDGAFASNLRKESAAEMVKKLDKVQPKKQVKLLLLTKEA